MKRTSQAFAKKTSSVAYVLLPTDNTHISKTGLDQDRKGRSHRRRGSVHSDHQGRPHQSRQKVHPVGPNRKQRAQHGQLQRGEWIGTMYV